MEVQNNAINWFEIPVLDFDRARNFYETIFGYQLEEQIIAGDRMGFFPVRNGGVSGAICQGPNYKPTDGGVKIYFSCGNDLLPVMEKIDQAGGEVVLPKTEISPEIGYFCLFKDTEGNHLALYSNPA